MPNDGIRLKIILIIEVRKLEFTDFDSHSLIFIYLLIGKREGSPSHILNIILKLRQNLTYSNIL